MKFLDTEPNEVRFIGILETNNGWSGAYVASDLLHKWHDKFEWTGGPKKEEVDATMTTFRSEINVEKLVVKYTLEIMNFLHILPTTYQITTDELVLLCSGVGLIEAESAEELERIGFSCIDHLEKFSYNVMKNSPSSLDPRCARRLDNINLSSLSRLEHLSLFLVGKNDSSIIRLQSCCRLKTLILRGNFEYLPGDMFLGLGELRALDVRGTNLHYLPYSFKKLELLRYLDVSKTPIMSLSELCHVTKLETLRLRGCSEFSHQLPEDLSKLINLRHLKFGNWNKLSSLPKGFGNLTKLLSLETFPVGKEDGTRLGELMNMNELRGSIRIRQLENVLSEEDAKRASLHTKKNIKELSLDWGDSRRKDTNVDEKVLEYLRPHFSLERLQILGYNGKLLPSWISSPYFSGIVTIDLMLCNSCAWLSSLGQLPSLKNLDINRMDGVSNINALFCRESPTNNDYHAFPKLEKLDLRSMSNLESWTGVEEGDFPSLLRLGISCCRRLVTLPTLSSIKSLKKINLYDCPVLSRRLLQDLPCNLEEFRVTDCPTLKERSHTNVSHSNLPPHADEIYVDYDQVQVD
ncbi:hypothetical protein Leryth_021558 [Lithospermum erythrorhizon]|nr:hypothetical protein Leryth_021558 [Lithospermum erythrorhizon]